MSERRTERLVNPAYRCTYSLFCSNSTLDSQRAAGVPREGRRSELRVHAGSLHSRGPCVGEQDSLPSGQCRLALHQRRHRGPRVHGWLRRQEMSAGGEEQVSRGSEGPHPSTEVRLRRPQTPGRSSRRQAAHPAQHRRRPCGAATMAMMVRWPLTRWWVGQAFPGTCTVAAPQDTLQHVSRI